MPELRFDYTTADWVVFAPLRKLRPQYESRAPLSVSEASQDAADCPFCPGNERFTPHEIFSFRSNPEVETSWQVRVVPNKFPALRIEEDHHRVQGGKIFERMGGCGAHEVVVESQDHSRFLAQQSMEQTELLLKTLQQRYIDLKRDKRFQTIIVFKNHGAGAGTSLKHPHWQIIATPVVPRLLRTKCSEAMDYYDRTGNCLYCDLTLEELAAEKRVIATNDEFAAFVPYAAHLPFETWILPRRQQSTFDQLEPRQVGPLAEILKNVLLKLYVGLENPNFNLTIDAAPRGDEDKEYFQWHIRIMPRLATQAGFELGSGMSINTVLPEEAAAFLRNGNSE